MSNPLKIVDVVLRDAHQSLFATRMRIDDMLPIAAELDKIGYWALETWGGATFDSCIRFLGEDPWERLRRLKAVMPNTPQQMLLRGQNLLGYRHYADDVVEKFVERSAANGMDVFRIFDALNDVRNLETAIRATVKVGKHAQGTLSYTVSPVHTLNTWLDMAKRLEDLDCHSIVIKDMAGLLKPYAGEELVGRLKETVQIPIGLHCHATTGLSTPTIVKCVEAGIDMVDTSISSMSQTYGHTATETIVSIFEGRDRDTGLDLNQLEKISAYFRTVRKKYKKFEGELQGIDPRILNAQVPGGMLTNMEIQLRDQGVSDKFDDVLREVPKIRVDLGYLPLVTPTSQIVGTQAVINVISGERYKTITKETAGVLKGEYGTTPAPVNEQLQARVLDGDEAVTCRPADLLEMEYDTLCGEFKSALNKKGLSPKGEFDDNVLTYALFPQIALKYFENQDKPSAFEPNPSDEPATPATSGETLPDIGTQQYQVIVDDRSFCVQVSTGGAIVDVQPAATPANPAPVATAPATSSTSVSAPLGGSVFKVVASLGQNVQEGDLLMVLEAMKMETEIRSPVAGTISQVVVAEGGQVQPGDTLVVLA